MLGAAMVRTMCLGPDQLIVAARAAFGAGIGAERAEDVADEAGRRLVERLTLVPHVFPGPAQTQSCC